MAQTTLGEDYTLAEEQGKKQREISISEFFTKNKHLLGFDNLRKALLTTIKEAVDNSLDACDESKILPEILVKVTQLEGDRFRIEIEDNGPGIVKAQVPKIFGKLLYGSKFFKLAQTRGQQGIGISAAAMYGQLTTGKPIKITSKISQKKSAYYYELHLDTEKNEPEIVKEQEVEWDKKTGTKISLELEAQYLKGKRSIDEYLKQTSIVNPHLHLIYISPDKNRIEYPRATKTLPVEAKEIKPHPYGIELGILINMLKSTKARTLQAFLTTDFSRVGSKTAKDICDRANINCNARPSRIARQEADNLIKSIKETRLVAPPTNCLSPITAEELEKGLRKEINAEFYCSITRPPSVYRGNPFIIEAALAYGGEQEREETIKVLRFANKVPLQFQQAAGAITKSIISTNWKPYGLSQSSGALPSGPVTLIVHIASVWVPFTSESKEAIAHYPEIIKEIKLAVQECGRQLGKYVNKKKKALDAQRKHSYIEKYIPYIGEALREILDLSENQEKTTSKILKETLENSRK